MSKCSVGDLETIGREIPAAEGLGRPTARMWKESAEVHSGGPKSIPPMGLLNSPRIHLTITFIPSISDTQHNVKLIVKNLINICQMNENCYIPYMGLQSLWKALKLRTFWLLTKVIECYMPTGVKGMTPFCS